MSYLRSHLQKLKCYSNESLLSNSFFLMLTSVVNAGFGLVFWLIAARMYDDNQVGVAVTLISTVALVVLVSRLGLDYSLVRYYQSGNKRMILGTSILVTTCAAVGVSLVIVVCAKAILPELSIFGDSLTMLLFVLIVSASSAFAFTGNAFMASRRSSMLFLQSMVMGLRIPLLFPFREWGVLGILSAVGLSFFLTLAVSAWSLHQMSTLPAMKIDYSYLRKSFRFSAGNYVCSLFMAGPSLALPIIVLGLLGAENAAYFYVAYSIVTIMFIVPNSVSQSLFVEGSHGESLAPLLRRALIVVVPVLLALGLTLSMLGNVLLGAFGPEYAEAGLPLLLLMILASIFVGLAYVYYAVQRVLMNMDSLVLVSGVISISLLVLSFILAGEYGLTGIGLAWILSYGFGNLIVLGGVILRRSKNRTSRCNSI